MRLQEKLTQEELDAIAAATVDIQEQLFDRADREQRRNARLVAAARIASGMIIDATIRNWPRDLTERRASEAAIFLHLIEDAVDAEYGPDES